MPGPLALSTLAPITEPWRFLSDPVAFALLSRRHWWTGEKLSILCVLVGTSVAISKVCSFGWRLCQRFGKIAWNKFGALWVTVLLLASFSSDYGKWFSELEGLIIRLLQGDKTDSVWLYEMVGWLILASGMEVVKFLFSNVPVRAATVKDPTHPWGGEFGSRDTPPGSESQRTGSGTGRGGRVFHDGRPPVCHDPHAGGDPPVTPRTPVDTARGFERVLPRGTTGFGTPEPER